MPDRPPNILFVITDQMRSTAMGCSGRESVISPHLDAFAAQGLRCTNALANSPTCTASRANLMTGLHTMRHGLVSNDLPLGTEHRCLAHALNEAGYDCGWIGKWHIDGHNRGAYIPPGPRRLGFDHYWAGVECNHHYMAGYHFDDETQEPVWHDRYEPIVQTDLAIDFMAKRAETGTDKPFFLGLSWGPPHCPYEQVPQRYRDMYDPAKIRLMPSAKHATVMDFQTYLDGVRPADIPDDEHERRKRQTIADYYAQVTALDEQFGRLMATLDSLGIADDTLVIFTSDHGDMLFNHNHGWKGKPWRESVGIPLLARWPGQIEAGRVSDAPIGLVDMMPTLAKVAGGTPTRKVDGKDYSAWLLGDESKAPKEQYINYVCAPSYVFHEGWRGVVTRTHTYACQPDGAWLLYHDAADPDQLENLIYLPEVKTLQRDLHQRMTRWLKRTGDDFATSEEIADRMIPGHTNNIHMFDPVPEPIREGQQAQLAAWRRGEKD